MAIPKDSITKTNSSMLYMPPLNKIQTAKNSGVSLSKDGTVSSNNSKSKNLLYKFKNFVNNTVKTSTTKSKTTQEEDAAAYKNINEQREYQEDADNNFIQIQNIDRADEE